MDKKNALVDIERALFDSIEKFGIEESLKEAMHYCLFPGGKRIRPIFAASLCFDLGGNPDPFFPHFAALELLHNSSLIHDDLPCLDNDELRRGRPTCHKKFGEARALLCGNALAALSFKIIAQHPGSAEQKISLLDSISGAYLSLCCGQQLDVLPEQERGEISRIHAKKTGALFAASFEFGAILAAANVDATRAAYVLGECFGIMFQVLDDFLDVYGEEPLRGRPPGSDERNAKNTFFSGRSFQDASDDLMGLFKKLELNIEELKKYSTGGELPNVEPLIYSIFAPLSERSRNA